MKTLIVVVALSTFGFATDAQAQYSTGSFYCLDACLGVVGGLDASIGVGGLVFGAGSMVKVGQGRISKKWFLGSYIFGSANLLLSVVWGGLAAGNDRDPIFWAGFISHAVIAVWNLVVPTIGYIRGEKELAPGQLGISPVVLDGRDFAGKRWAGLGIRVFGF